MAKKNISELEEILSSATSSSPNVTAKKMFGCHALWANTNVFALVWKHGRLGLKLPETASYESLMKTTGAEPWKAGPMTMAHWVLVPESFHEKPTELKKWAAKAHSLCSSLEKKAKKATVSKAAPAKKPAPRKPVRRKSK